MLVTAIQGQHSEAVSCYTECIQLCPDNPVAYTNRALCHLKLNAVSALYYALRVVVTLPC